MASATSYWTRKLGLPSRSKYGAQRTTVDGLTFDSKKEARRYRDLLLLGLAGELRDLELQPRFPIVVNGVRIGEYRADFRYWDARRGDVVEDVKGLRTPVYVLKRKLIEALYGITITEV